MRARTKSPEQRGRSKVVIEYCIEQSPEFLAVEAAARDIVDLLEYLTEHEESQVSTPKHVEKIDSFCDGHPAEDFPSLDAATPH